MVLLVHEPNKEYYSAHMLSQIKLFIQLTSQQSNIKKEGYKEDRVHLGR